MGFFIRIARMKFLFFVLAVSVALTQAKRFCPGEKNGDRCAAKQNHYKCGAFFEDLKDEGEGHLQWLGALPDALKKVTIQQKERRFLELASQKKGSLTLTHVMTPPQMPDA